MKNVSVGGHIFSSKLPKLPKNDNRRTELNKEYEDLENNVKQDLYDLLSTGRNTVFIHSIDKEDLINKIRLAQRLMGQKGKLSKFDECLVINYEIQEGLHQMGVTVFSPIIKNEYRLDELYKNIEEVL